MAEGRAPNVARRWYHRRLGFPRMSKKMHVSRFIQALVCEAYHIKSHQGVKLDQSMKVSKYD